MIVYYYAWLLAALPYFSNTPSDCETATLAFQSEWNAYFADSARTPLEPADFVQFQALPFFPFDEGFCVTATYIQAAESKAVTFQTTTNKPRIYYDVGKLYFEINAVPCTLTVYQTTPIATGKKRKKSTSAQLPARWFLPFKDLTNGSLTYGGGRYMDLLPVAAGAAITLNFNKAYPPLCAYSSRYSCPIVPDENSLPVAIEAGLAMETITK
jgi:uncharacterized protein